MRIASEPIHTYVSEITELADEAAVEVKVASTDAEPDCERLRSLADVLRGSSTRSLTRGR